MLSNDGARRAHCGDFSLSTSAIYECKERENNRAALLTLAISHFSDLLRNKNLGIAHISRIYFASLCSRYDALWFFFKFAH